MVSLSINSSSFKCSKSPFYMKLLFNLLDGVTIKAESSSSMGIVGFTDEQTLRQRFAEVDISDVPNTVAEATLELLVYKYGSGKLGFNIPLSCLADESYQRITKKQQAA